MEAEWKKQMIKDGCYITMDKYIKLKVGDSLTYNYRLPISKDKISIEQRIVAITKLYFDKEGNGCINGVVTEDSYDKNFIGWEVEGEIAPNIKNDVSKTIKKEKQLESLKQVFGEIDEMKAEKMGTLEETKKHIQTHLKMISNEEKAKFDRLFNDAINLLKISPSDFSRIINPILNTTYTDKDFNDILEKHVLAAREDVKKYIGKTKAEKKKLTEVEKTRKIMDTMSNDTVITRLKKQKRKEKIRAFFQKFKNVFKRNRKK